MGLDGCRCFMVVPNHGTINCKGEMNNELCGYVYYCLDSYEVVFNKYLEFHYKTDELEYSVAHNQLMKNVLLFDTYNEAEKAKQEWETGLEIERNLSDYDLSIKEMDKVLKMFHDDNFAEKCMNKLLSMDRVEDIEIKKSDNKVLWRYFMTPLDDGYKENKWKHYCNFGRKLCTCS